jgi:AcrR family transcriptional regulator
MSLFEHHKAERRERIRLAARRLVAKHGYDGLTMRDLAREAAVSVPTLYNLFGSKDAILAAEVEVMAAAIAAQLPLGGDSFFKRGQAAFDASMQQIEQAPELYRGVMQVFMTSPETGPMRRRAEHAFTALIAGNLIAARAAGQLADWAEPMIVARHMFTSYMAVFLSWGIGELDLAGFRATALSSVCHLLAGVARGQFATDVEAQLRELASEPALQPPSEARVHASEHAHD